MDTKFYHLYIDIDISHAKNFLQSANIGEGALGFSGGHGPLLPPLATGLGRELIRALIINDRGRMEGQLWRCGTVAQVI
jgi:hypothetical protein